mgnify:CR=1 FL=1
MFFKHPEKIIKLILVKKRMNISIDVDYNTNSNYDMVIRVISTKTPKIVCSKANIGFRELIGYVEETFRKRLCHEDTYILTVSNIAKKISPDRIGILEKMISFKNDPIKLTQFQNSK